MKILLSISQIALAVLLMLMFFEWAPLINCQSLDELSSTRYREVKIPENAKCFEINHGKIHFLNKLPIDEDPIPFIISSLYLFLCLAVLIVINWYSRKLGNKGATQRDK